MQGFLKERSYAHMPYSQPVGQIWPGTLFYVPVRAYKEYNMCNTIPCCTTEELFINFMSPGFIIQALKASSCEVSVNPRQHLRII